MKNGFEYLILGQVDVMLNRGDVFFNLVVNNKFSLLFFIIFDDRIYFEYFNGLKGVVFK